jgi:hypothetical protein
MAKTTHSKLVGLVAGISFDGIVFVNDYFCFGASEGDDIS